MKELSIILVNYNTTEDMVECINSILRSEIKISYEIIVVDNDSNKQAEVVSRLRNTFEDLKIVAKGRNLGFACANNIGIKYAVGKMLLFLNPDVIVDKYAIMQLYEFMQRHPEAGLVGPLTIDSSGKLDYYCGFSFPTLISEILHHSGLSKIFPKSRFFGQGLMTYWDHKTTKEVEAIQGSAMMVRMDDILKIGNMDENFFLFCEDTDWCYRYRKSGKKNYLCA
ncbi:MAG: glycosyltransferase family 2 protein, partial [candidate division WOR-3 bacterium]